MPRSNLRRVDPNADLWGDIDPSLLEGARGEIPVFPVHIFPAEWRQRVQDTAAAAGAPADYVGQGLLACVAAVAGAGVIAEVRPGWREPTILWQALVGAPSSGKSPALGAARRLLDPIEAELRAGDDERLLAHQTKVEHARLQADKWKEECETAFDSGAPPPIKPAEAAFDDHFVPRQIAVSDATIEALVDVVSGSSCGIILWRDELTAWLCNLSRYSNGSDRPHYLEGWAGASVTVNRKSRSGPLHLPRFPVSIIGTIQPDRLADALEGADDGLAVRFLFSWPDPPPYRSILEQPVARDEEALSRLRRIAGAAGTSEQPRVLQLSADALVELNTFLSELHAETLSHEGLEAGFMGKGRGTVVRLAAVLALLRWSEKDSVEAPTTIDIDAVRDATGLWADYMHPHAQAVFNTSGRAGKDKQARRAVRWLRSTGTQEVSREDVRCLALGRAVDAEGADDVIRRLVAGSVLCALPAATPSKGGRPARRWQVNPALAARQEDGGHA